MKYAKKLNKLGLLEYPSKKPDITRIKKALKELKNPQNLFASIHIAGTNGKGSTAVMLSEILRANGYKVGLYTSPHLITIHERIKINQKNIEENQLEEILKETWNLVEKYSLTYFETLTLSAFIYFANEKIDIAVIETGLGGKYDATNTINNVLISIITPVDFDHTELLGKNIESIASEKAGIIKKNTHVVTAKQKKEIEKIIKETASNLNSKLFILGNDFNYKFLCYDWTVPEQKFSYFGNDFSYSDISLSLLGKHQLINASLSIKSVNILKKNGYIITEESIKEALKNTKWPARFQIFNYNKTKFIIDGAHNPHGAISLSETLKDYGVKDKEITFVMNIMREKDYKNIVKILSKFAKKVIIFKSKSPRSLSYETLYSEWLNFIDKNKVKIMGNFNEIFNEIKKEKIVCWTGSLYFAGQVLKFLNDKRIL